MQSDHGSVKPKIFVTYPIDFPEMDALYKSEKFDVVVSKKPRVLTHAELLESVTGYDALVTQLSDIIDASVMDKAGDKLRLIANYAVGFDNVAVLDATKRKIAVTNTPDASSTAVAEHAMALMLACAKNLSQADDFVRRGKYKGWDPQQMIGVELSGKKLGIIGCGKIGSLFALNCYHGLGMKILYHDVCKNYELERTAHAYQVSLNSLLRSTDVVSLHVPLLPTTKHLMNARTLALMKPSAILINTSRGPVVDEKALTLALKGKKIMAAGLDVYENDPELAPGLKDLENTVLTPHSASATLEARGRMAQMLVENVTEFFSGKVPPSLVNQEIRHIIEEEKC